MVNPSGGGLVQEPRGRAHAPSRAHPGRHRMHRLPTLTAGLATITLMSGAVAFGGITTAATASVARHPVPAAPSSGGVTVKTSHSSTLGTHLVTASGRSLYAFNK